MHFAGDVSREQDQVRPPFAEDLRQRGLDLRRRLEERIGVISRAQPVKVLHTVEVEAVRLRTDDDHTGRRESDPARDLVLQIEAVPRSGRNVGCSSLEREQCSDPGREAHAPPSRAGKARGEGSPGDQGDRRHHRQEIERQLRARQREDRDRHEDAGGHQHGGGAAQEAGGDGAAAGGARAPHLADNRGQGGRSPGQSADEEGRQVDDQGAEKSWMALVAFAVEPPGDLVVEQVAGSAGNVAQDRQIPEPGERQGDGTGEGDTADDARRPELPVDDDEAEQRGQLHEHRRALAEQTEARGDAGEEPGPSSGAGARRAGGAHDPEPGPGREAGERQIRRRRVAGDERQQRSTPGEGREGAGRAIPEGVAECGDGEGGQQVEEREADADAPLVLPEEGDTAGHSPEQQRRLVEEVQTGKVRHQPVAGVEHLQRDAAVAPLVRFPEPARALKGESEQQQEKEDRGADGEPGAAGGPAHPAATLDEAARQPARPTGGCGRCGRPRPAAS